MDLWMSFITCVKDNQPCTRSSLEFRGKGKYKKYIDEAFNLGLIEQGIHKNKLNEDLISLTQKGENFFNKKLTIEEVKGEINK